MRRFLSVTAAALFGSFVLVAGVTSAAPGAAPVAGTLGIDAGTCSGGTASGSTFRMILPSGDTSGPFVSNGDSTCDDQTYTLLRPGSDGGLVLGDYQPAPSPAFDGNGNGRADRIIEPTMFFGVGFAIASNPTDPQTGQDVPAPSITADGGSLSGDLQSIGAAWNDQDFNQGAPKPGKAPAGLTAGPTGTFDPSTGAYTLDWASQIQGGPFDKFTGVWHLEGTLRTAGTRAPTAAPPTTAASGDAVVTATTAAPTGDGVPASGPATTTTQATEALATGDDVDGASDGGDGTRDEVAIDAELTGGREAPTWLILVVLVLGLAAIAGYILSDKAIRKRQDSP